MAVTGTKTVRDMCTQALRAAQVTAYDEDPEAADIAAAVEELNLMLKAWQLWPGLFWLTTSMSHTLTAAASQTLDPVRPFRILSCRFKRSATANEIPMISMTRLEYDELPRKDTTGTPTQFHYDRQREAARLYVWPILSSATAETLEITYEKEFDDVTDASATLQVPAEWWESCLYNLAAILAERYQLSSYQVLAPRATASLDRALAQEREGSVFFSGPYTQ